MFYMQHKGREKAAKVVEFMSVYGTYLKAFMVIFAKWFLVTFYGTNQSLPNLPDIPDFTPHSYLQSNYPIRNVKKKKKI